MREVFCSDDKCASPAQAVKLSQVAKISTSISRHEATFTNAIHSLLRYAQEFEEDYGVNLVDARIMHVLNDMMSSSFVLGSNGATYILYINDGTIMTKYEAVSERQWQQDAHGSTRVVDRPLDLLGRCSSTRLSTRFIFSL